MTIQNVELTSTLKLGALLLFTCLPLRAFAGGMTVGDVGPHAEGRGGAFTAKADDMSAIEYNPAGLTGIGGTQIYLGNRFGYAVEEYKRATIVDNGERIDFASVSNEHPWQLLDPLSAVGSNFGLENWAFALGAYAPPGIATQHYPENGGQRYMLIDRDVKILYYNLSAAFKFRDLFGLGASLQWVDAAQIKLSLIIDGRVISEVHPVDNGTKDQLATVTGADHVGFSAILGAWIKPLPFLQIALSGRIVPTPIDADCTLNLKNFSGEWVDPTLTRNGEPANNVTLSMKLPPTARLGVRYLHNKGDLELFDVEVDFVYEAWSVMEQYKLESRDLVANLGVSNVAVGTIVIPKKWNGTFSVRLGGDYNVVPRYFTLRAGTFFETGATNKPYAYADFYSSHRIGGTFGASVRFVGFDLSLSYAYVYEMPFTVGLNEGRIYQQAPGSPCEPPYTDPDNCDSDYLGQPSAVANAGDYNAHFHFASVSLSYLF